MKSQLRCCQELDKATENNRDQSLVVNVHDFTSTSTSTSYLLLASTLKLKRVLVCLGIKRREKHRYTYGIYRDCTSIFYSVSLIILCY